MSVRSPGEQLDIAALEKTLALAMKTLNPISERH
jgi:hypothetical protein